jgi:hypothetical protein
VFDDKRCAMLLTGENKLKKGGIVRSCRFNIENNGLNE